MRSYVVAFAVASLSAIVAATPAAAEGFRAEIHGGWDHASVDDFDDNGVVYGIGLGYDLAVGKNAFVGVDLNLDDSTQKECETSVIVASDTLCVKAGRDLSAGIRAGVNVSDKGKVYALAAYTNARFKQVYTDASGTDRFASNLDGFRLGAGYQHMLGGNTYGKVEYRYSNYENDVDRHQVLVGVGLTF